MASCIAQIHFLGLTGAGSSSKISKLGREATSEATIGGVGVEIGRTKCSLSDTCNTARRTGKRSYYIRKEMRDPGLHCKWSTDGQHEQNSDQAKENRGSKKGRSMKSGVPYLSSTHALHLSHLISENIRLGCVHSHRFFSIEQVEELMRDPMQGLPPDES
ncbi:hypothetical protein CDL15_Pgr005998 [Punica granatum]|uniref:Uncharacterized protein n=1 Tax=Punica granatum TaxID=22663 RepID=A0A218VTM8_PUNGR|nr:hypothetical protein CDL15_Pgr005998 [Punica granatum]